MARAAIVLLLASACASSIAQDQKWDATLWRDANRLFHSDRRWLGADAAFSVPLDADRVLWLFGDTFVGDGKVARAKAAMINNSIAVQQGRNPARAEIGFYWARDAAAPASYFSAKGKTWLWPLHGVARNGALTLFFMRVNPSNAALGFTLAGSTIRRCENFAGDPGAWQFRGILFPAAPAGLRLLYGVALLEAGDYVLAYCVEESGAHDAYLVRWPAADFDRGDFAAPEWWDGARYVPQGELTDAPAVVLAGAQTEFSVHRLPDGRYIQVQTLGFGAANVGCRYAPRPEGPWSASQPIYRPRESRATDAFVYAAKAHPELEGAPLIVTYAANSFNPRRLLRSRTLYYPRFVRLEPIESK